MPMHTCAVTSLAGIPAPRADINVTMFHDILFIILVAPATSNRSLGPISCLGRHQHLPAWRNSPLESPSSQIASSRGAQP